MADLGNVLKGLECCTTSCGMMSDCPYSQDCHGGDPEGVSKQMLTDALVLLKEQNTVNYAIGTLRANGWDVDGKGKKPDSFKSHHFCGECFEEIRVGDKYCWNCGRLVDWDA